MVSQGLGVGLLMMEVAEGVSLVEREWGEAGTDLKQV